MSKRSRDNRATIREIASNLSPMDGETRSNRLRDKGLGFRREPRLTVEEARIAFPIGALVRFYPVEGEAGSEESRVCSEPWALGHGAVVVKIDGRAGGVLVTHLRRVEE